MTEMPSRYQQVYEYADPYRSTAYEMDDSGHGWDRLAAIAGEYERGEITWRQARAWCDENAADLLAAAN